MIRKLLLAALLLPLSSLAFAGDINPGDDNPGTTFINKSFNIAGFVTDSDSCLDVSEWCTAQLMDTNTYKMTKKGPVGQPFYDADAGAYATVACMAAADAQAGWLWFYEGGGDWELARHGNNGAMHHITLDMDMTTAALSGTHAGAEASAMAFAGAYAYAAASTWEEECDSLVVNEDPLELFEWCAYAEAAAEAGAGALALAASHADSEAFALSGAFGSASIYNEVWAANIEQYQATVAAASGSFAYTNAEAAAEAFAGAYAAAFANAYAKACTSNSTLFEEICSESEAEAEAEAWAYAYAYAEALAEALAYARVEVILPVKYVNENGIYDTIEFGTDTTISTFGGLNVSCVVPQEPTPDP